MHMALYCLRVSTSDIFVARCVFLVRQLKVLHRLVAIMQALLCLQGVTVISVSFHTAPVGQGCLHHDTMARDELVR